MYPAGELSAIAFRKAALRGFIAAERRQCAAAAERVMRPLARIDNLRTRWQGVPPVVKLALVPLGAWSLRRLFPRVRVLALLMRWALGARSRLRRRPRTGLHGSRPRSA